MISVYKMGMLSAIGCQYFIYHKYLFIFHHYYEPHRVDTEFVHVAVSEKQIPWNAERKSDLCVMQVVKNELHFILGCPLRHLPKVHNGWPQFYQIRSSTN